MSAEASADAQGSIGSAAIVPAAEPGSGDAQAHVSGSLESAFFAQGKAEYDYKIAQANLGVLGRFFGASSAAPGATNIAGFIAILALIGIFVTYALPGSNPDLPDVRKLLLGLTSTALAFIFGAATRPKNG